MHKNNPNHRLFKTGDRDAPEEIKDRNGHVALSLCRKCGKAEIELTAPCPFHDDEEILPGEYALYEGYWYLVDGEPTRARTSSTVRAFKKAHAFYEARNGNAVKRGLNLL